MTRDNTVFDDISQHQISARLTDGIVRMYAIYTFFWMISSLVVYLITITTYENSKLWGLVALFCSHIPTILILLGMQTSKVLSLVNNEKPNFPDERV